MAADKIQSSLAYLKTEFLRDAKVIDPLRGYISISSFNLRMKPQVLKSAAAIIAQHFGNDRIDIVHGIPPLRQLSGDGSISGTWRVNQASRFPQRSKYSDRLERCI